MQAGAFCGADNGGGGGGGCGAGPGGHGDGDSARGGGGGDFDAAFEGDAQKLHLRHLHLVQWNFLNAESHHLSHVGASHLYDEQNAQALHLQSLQWWWANAELHQRSQEAFAQ